MDINVKSLPQWAQEPVDLMVKAGLPWVQILAVLSQYGPQIVALGQGAIALIQEIILKVKTFPSSPAPVRGDAAKCCGYMHLEAQQQHLVQALFHNTCCLNDFSMFEKKPAA